MTVPDPWVIFPVHTFTVDDSLRVDRLNENFALWYSVKNGELYEWHFEEDAAHDAFDDDFAIEVAIQTTYQLFPNSALFSLDRTSRWAIVDEFESSTDDCEVLVIVSGFIVTSCAKGVSIAIGVDGSISHASNTGSGDESNEFRTTQVTVASEPILNSISPFYGIRSFALTATFVVGEGSHTFQLWAKNNIESSAATTRFENVHFCLMKLR